MALRYCPHCLLEVGSNDVSCPHCRHDTRVENLPSQIGVGTLLRGAKSSYRIGRAIGSGGFGQTYLALDLTTRGFVAVKEYFPKRCNPQRLPDGSVRPTGPMASLFREGMGSFLKEATMLAALQRIDSIVHVSDYFEDFGTAYMVMDFVIGETLASYVQMRGPMAYAVLERPLVKLIRDVDIINRAGVVHRDINPQNVILTPEGKLRLIDFGCARSMEDGRSMEVLLTPGFAPTEQYSRHGQGPYTDVYALCATIYYCLTAKVPPSSNNRANAVYRKEQDPLLAPSLMGVVLPTGVEDVLMGGLAIFSQDRTQTMGELADRLEAIRRRQPPDSVTIIPEHIVEVPPLEEPEGQEEDAGEHVSWWSHWGMTIVACVAVVVGLAFVAYATLCSTGT